MSSIVVLLDGGISGDMVDIIMMEYRSLATCQIRTLNFGFPLEFLIIESESVPSGAECVCWRQMTWFRRVPTAKECCMLLTPATCFLAAKQAKIFFYLRRVLRITPRYGARTRSDDGQVKNSYRYRDNSELLGVIGGRLLPVRRHYTVLSGVQKWREAGGAKMAGRDLRTK